MADDELLLFPAEEGEILDLDDEFVGIDEETTAEKQEQTGFSKEGEKYVCFCGTQCSTYFGLSRHWEHSHEKVVVKYQCPDCTFVNVKIYDMIKHINNAHNRNEDKENIKSFQGHNKFYLSPKGKKAPAKNRVGRPSTQVLKRKIIDEVETNTASKVLCREENPEDVDKKLTEIKIELKETTKKRDALTKSVDNLHFMEKKLMVQKFKKAPGSTETLLRMRVTELERKVTQLEEENRSLRDTVHNLSRSSFSY